jgi:hypothetical protein
MICLWGYSQATKAQRAIQAAAFHDAPIGGNKHARSAPGVTEGEIVALLIKSYAYSLGRYRCAERRLLSTLRWS